MARFSILVFMLLVSQCFGGIWKRQSRQEHAVRGLSYEEIRTMEFDMNVLRPQDMPDTVVVSEALKAIEDLNRKQFCHRLSASMLLDNCRTDLDLQSGSLGALEQERREDYLKIFAVALTMCDIEALQRTVPAPCAPYGQNALMAIKDRGDTQTIELNSQEMSGCLKAIGQDQSAVVSWKINQQSAAVVCQVTRMDIEKDEAIALFGRLTRLLSDVVDETQKLTKLTKETNREAHIAKETVTEVRTSIGNLKDNLAGIWSGLSREAAKAQHSTQEAFGSMTKYASEFDQLLSKLRRNALDNHAAQASVFQRNVEASSELAVKTMETQKEMDELKGMVHGLYDTMNVMGQGLVALQERQEKVDRQSAKVLSAMVNMTELMHDATEAGQDHTYTLSKATAAANSLLDILAKSESHASTWQQQMLAGSGPFGIGWLLFIGTPMSTVALGSYKRRPSILQTVGLALLGVPLAIVISISCDYKWQSMMAEYFAQHPLMPIPTAASETVETFRSQPL